MVTPLEEAMLMHGKEIRRQAKHQPPPFKAPPAKCPGRSYSRPCQEGPISKKTKERTPAPLGIDVDQAARAEQLTGKPVRCFKCSETPA